MARKLPIILIIVFIATICFAHLPPTGIKDEGGSETKPVFTIDCVGDGIACTHSGVEATLTVAGGGCSSYDLQVNGQGLSDANFTDNAFIEFDFNLATDPDTVTGTLATDGVTVTAIDDKDAPADEECLTYEADTNDFEWESCGSGGGDSVTVNSTAADTTANFLDNIYMDFDIADGGAGGPDDVTGKFEYAQTLAGDPALGVDEIIFFADTSGPGFLSEGSTANTNEQLYRFPDVDGADTTSYFMLDDTSITGIDDTTLEVNSATLRRAALTGDVTASAGSNTTAIGAGVIIEPDLDADVAPTDEDFLQYDSTGTNFTWRSDTEVISDLSSAANDWDSNGDVVDDSHNHVITNIDSFTKAQLETQTSDVSDYAEADGDTYTGAHDFGGASGFEIPSGTNPTVDADGEMALDITGTQIVIDGGSSVAVFTTFETKCGVVENLAAADDNFMFFSPDQNITLSNAWCVCEGTCTTEADLSFEIRQIGTASTVDDVGGTVDCEDSATAETKTDLTSDNTVEALDVLRFDVDNAVSPETDEYIICIEYIVDRQ